MLGAGQGDQTSPGRGWDEDFGQILRVTRHHREDGEDEETD